MPIYECRVRSKSGEMRQLSLEAPSAQVAVERLHREGHFVLQVHEQRVRSERRGFILFKRARLDELVAFSREFAVMIRAGIPLMEALQTMIEHMRPGVLREALEKVRNEVEGGIPLSEAMRRQPHAFPDLYVNLVQSAEASGSLDEVLKRAADYLSDALALQRRVKSAMMYPAVVFIATLFVMAYMVVFIMPKFSEMFRQMNVNLPITTKALVWLGDLGGRHKLPVLLSPLWVLGGLWGAWQSPRVREPLRYWIARLPLVGDLTRKVVLTRTLSALQTLIATGVALPRALDLAAATSGDHRMRHALATIRAEVEAGIPLATAMRETGIFPSLVVQLVAAGEKTGALPEMLGEVVTFYDDEVQQKLKGLTSTLEPILMLFLGLVIGIFAFSVISPIYDLMGTIK
ncbi:Putative type II secretion system protein F [bacterium HR15]|nr:Putative type II secretion system protein F [bacterium HR15]